MTSMDNTPDSPAKTPEGYTTQGGNFWTLITPEIWKVLHAVLQMLDKLLHHRVYLGHILHKEKSYPGQHEAIIDQALWDAVHTILAANNRQRQSETWQRRSPDALLLGLFFTQDGERYQPAHTRKANGKSYRYYVPIRKLRFGADASEAGRVPAEPIEQLVLAQVYAVLKAPEAVQAVGCGSRPASGNLGT